MEEIAPKWFRLEIARGLARLVALSLPGQPPSETIEATREVWIEALWPGRLWVEELDIPRLREGFRRLAAEVERWPAPRHYKDLLPERPVRQELPEPEPTPEQRAATLRRLAVFRKVIVEKMAVADLTDEERRLYEEWR